MHALHIPDVNMGLYGRLWSLQLNFSTLHLLSISLLCFQLMCGTGRGRGLSLPLPGRVVIGVGATREV